MVDGVVYIKMGIAHPILRFVFPLAGDKTQGIGTGDTDSL